MVDEFVVGIDASAIVVDVDSATVASFEHLEHCCLASLVVVIDVESVDENDTVLMLIMIVIGHEIVVMVVNAENNEALELLRLELTKALLVVM